jgi:uncharacterized protein (TIGR03435 family)
MDRSRDRSACDAAPSRGSVLALVVLALNVTNGQVPIETFEVASVKATDPSYVGPSANSGGATTSDPERVVYKAVFLRQLLLEAYDMQAYQVIGPAWMGSQRYDIVAKVPAGTTKEQYRLMLQALLRERLALSLHREPREKTVFELSVAQGMPKLRIDHSPPHSKHTGRPTDCAHLGDLRCFFTSAQTRFSILTRQ